MHRHIGRLQPWRVLGLAILLLTAGCTAAQGIEPSAGKSEQGSAVATVTRNTGAVIKQPEAVVIGEETDATGDTTEPTGETVTGANPAVVGLDSTIDANVEIFTEDNRSDRLRSLTSGWATDWNRRTIDYGEILSGGPPRDGIPSIDEPRFIGAEEAAAWLADNEPVVTLEINGDARAYPLQLLTWHEIVNDTVGDLPVVVTFCPLCNSALVFDRRVNGEAVEFGVSGLLRNSDLIMYDRSTETLWQQFTGEAIIGDLAGRQLEFLASAIVSFADFRTAYPDGIILSRETGFTRQYGLNPYAGYDTMGQNPFLFDGIIDGRLPAMERVVTVPLEDLDVAYPLSILSEVGVINDNQGGQDMVVFHTGGTNSALGDRVIAVAEDVGATGVFDPHLNGQKLTFIKKGEAIVDEETGTVWNILGQAVEGSLAGQQLIPIIHADHFWFSWAAFKPDTIIYQY
jgi:hypothetical protein